MYDSKLHEGCYWIRTDSCFSLCKTQEERDNFVFKKCCEHPRHEGKCVPVDGKGVKCGYFEERSLLRYK